jgi:hypothetical protein
MADSAEPYKATDFWEEGKLARCPVCVVIIRRPKLLCRLHWGCVPGEAQVLMEEAHRRRDLVSLQGLLGRARARIMKYEARVKRRRDSGRTSKEGE